MEHYQHRHPPKHAYCDDCESVDIGIEEHEEQHGLTTPPFEMIREMYCTTCGSPEISESTLCMMCNQVDSNHEGNEICSHCLDKMADDKNYTNPYLAEYSTKYVNELFDGYISKMADFIENDRTAFAEFCAERIKNV